MKRIWKQVYQRYCQFAMYIVMGFLTTAVGLILFYVSIGTLLDGTDALQLQVANIISWTGSVTFAYIGNRIFVFRSKSAQILKEIAFFALSRVSTLLLDMSVMFVGVTLCGFSSDIVKCVSVLLVTAANYIFSRFCVFRTEDK